MENCSLMHKRIEALDGTHCTLGFHAERPVVQEGILLLKCNRLLARNGKTLGSSQFLKESQTVPVEAASCWLPAASHQTLSAPVPFSHWAVVSTGSSGLEQTPWDSTRRKRG